MTYTCADLPFTTAYHHDLNDMISPGQPALVSGYAGGGKLRKKKSKAKRSKAKRSKVKRSKVKRSKAKRSKKVKRSSKRRR